MWKPSQVGVICWRFCAFAKKGNTDSGVRGSHCSISSVKCFMIHSSGNIPMHKVDLAFDSIDGARPEHAIAFLHGILGRGANLRTIAKRFVEARPEWTAWLVDLRGHGQSPKSTPNPSLEAAAVDVVALARQSGLPLAAIAGHSFGGKVALEAARLGDLAMLEHVLVIDSLPGSRPPLRGGYSALAVIDTIANLPPSFPSITEFVKAIEGSGLSRDIAQWLSGSLERNENQVRFALDLNEIRGLILDYFERDLWPVVEQPPHDLRIHLVIGDHSESYSAEDRERARRIAASNPRVTVDVLPTGHWVHVEDPDGLMQTLLRHIS